MARNIVTFLFHAFYIFHTEAFNDTRVIRDAIGMYEMNASNFEAGDVSWFNSRINDTHVDSSSTHFPAY